jgi:hypothetical protein
MPGELLPQTGLILPRARASRVTARSMLTRELGPCTEATAEYAFNEDRIADGLSVRVHTATIGAERHLSRRTSARIAYRGEHDSFGPQPAAAASSVSSHALTATWRRAVSSRVSLALTAGPRLTGSRVAPELFVTLQTRLERGAVAVGYQRTQTTVIGMPRPVDIENVTGRVVWGAAQGPSARIEPGFLRSRAGGQRTDVYRVGLGIDYPIGRTLSFDIAVDTNVQHGRLHAAFAGGRISRHTATIRLVSSGSRRDR